MRLENLSLRIYKVGCWKGGETLLFKDQMKKQRYNYGSMANVLGVTRITVSNWDRGITSPTLFQAKSISDLLDMEVKELLDNAKKLKEMKYGKE
jgi:predicted transcriptional regulator